MKYHIESPSLSKSSKNKKNIKDSSKKAIQSAYILLFIQSWNTLVDA